MSAIKDVLESIQKTVKSRRIPKFFKSVAMSGDIAGKIKSCSGKLDWAMTVFQVSLRGTWTTSYSCAELVTQVKSDININMILAEVQATVKEMASAVQRIVSRVNSRCAMPAEAVYGLQEAVKRSPSVPYVHPENSFPNPALLSFPAFRLSSYHPNRPFSMVATRTWLP